VVSPLRPGALCYPPIYGCLSEPEIGHPKRPKEAGFRVHFPLDYGSRGDFGLRRETGTQIFTNETQKNLKMSQTEAEMASDECIPLEGVALMILYGMYCRFSRDLYRSPHPL
jgi:hypothetical protein